ncbi:ATP-binding protein [Falsiroseomonas sp. CW058]|uniref:ATP-binding protein n=1 Tax=Falsiroseomonas sp. CW058 TaxID=3388664 RepID=UPI003D319A65
MPRRGRASFWPLWTAAILLPAAVFLLTAWITWRNVTAEAESRVARLADMLHEQTLRAFETQEALLTAADARIAGMAWDAVAASAEVHGFLLRLAESAPFTAGLGLVDAAGWMVLRAGAEPFPQQPLDQRDRDYVRAYLEGARGTFVGGRVTARPSGQQIFVLSRPRSGPEGGVLASSFRVDQFTRFYASIVEAPGDRVALIHADGAVLARFPVPTGAEPRLPPDSPTLRMMAEGRRAGLFTVRSGLDGTLRLNAFRRVGDYPVAVIYGFGPATMQRAWMARLAAPAVICLAAAALLLLLTARVTRSARREGAAMAAAAADAHLARIEAERRAEMEARLRRSERNAALGQVAAGVAHDMNNLVQSVVASSRLLDRRAGDVTEVRRIARLMDEAATRGARLARRMLEFGRAAPDGAERFAPAEVLGRLEALLDGLLGSGLRVECAAPQGLPPIRADRREFETVLVNLIVNARDSMPQGGVVRVLATLEQGAGPPEAPRQAPMLRVSVADHGTGMPPEVLARAEEPFFTTKGADQGTGLGLTMARQFAERSGGAMRIDSVQGRGTTVTLWLPVASAGPSADSPGGRLIDAG